MADQGEAQQGETIYANYDAILASEVAREIVNRGRGIVQDRIYKLEAEGDAEGAQRLRVGPARELFTLLRSIDYREEARVRSVIETWGPRVRDEAALWEALDGR